MSPAADHAIVPEAAVHPAEAAHNDIELEPRER
jgi:hypothetical protein